MYIHLLLINIFLPKQALSSDQSLFPQLHVQSTYTFHWLTFPYLSKLSSQSYVHVQSTFTSHWSAFPYLSKLSCQIRDSIHSHMYMYSLHRPVTDKHSLTWATSPVWLEPLSTVKCTVYIHLSLINIPLPEQNLSSDRCLYPQLHVQSIYTFHWSTFPYLSKLSCQIRDCIHSHMYIYSLHSPLTDQHSPSWATSLVRLEPVPRVHTFTVYIHLSLINIPLPKQPLSSDWRLYPELHLQVKEPAEFWQFWAQPPLDEEHSSMSADQN